MNWHPLGGQMPLGLSAKRGAEFLKTLFAGRPLMLLVRHANTPALQALGMDQLTREQCILLVQEIWSTIVADTPPTLLVESQRAELRHRIAGDHASPNDAIPREKI